MREKHAAHIKAALKSCRDNERAIEHAKRLRDETRKLLARAIVDARKQYGLTATEVASHCGVSKGFYSDFELGRRWSDDVVAKLVKLFGADQ